MLRRPMRLSVGVFIGGQRSIHTMLHPRYGPHPGTTMPVGNRSGWSRAEPVTDEPCPLAWGWGKPTSPTRQPRSICPPKGKLVCWADRSAEHRAPVPCRVGLKAVEPLGAGRGG